LRDLELRNFLLVARQDGGRVEFVYETPRETPHSTEALDQAFLTVWRRARERFSPRGFDVVVARGANIRAVRAALPQLKEWNHAKRFRIDPRQQDVEYEDERTRPQRERIREVVEYDYEDVDE
jgi:hypothetical protein